MHSYRSMTSYEFDRIEKLRKGETRVQKVMLSILPRKTMSVKPGSHRGTYYQPRKSLQEV